MERLAYHESKGEVLPGKSPRKKHYIRLAAICFALGLFSTKEVAATSSTLDCAAEVESIDGKFNFKTHLGTWKLSEANPDRLCEANSDAFHDKIVGGNSEDESSVCRSTYLKLKAAVEDYKRKFLSACERGKKIGDGCVVGTRSEDPKAAFRCVSANAKQAAAAERMAAEALRRASKLATDLQKQADKVRNSYIKDLNNIETAFIENDLAIKRAELAGNALELEGLINLRANATGVRNGKLVVNNSFLDQTAMSPRNGGVSTITGYKGRLSRNPGSDSQYGLLVNEQNWASDTAASFNRTAAAEIRERTSSAERLSQYAEKNDILIGDRTIPGNPTAKNPSGPLSTLTGLAGAAGLAAPLAAMANQANSTASQGSSTADPGAQYPGTAGVNPAPNLPASTALGEPGDGSKESPVGVGTPKVPDILVARRPPTNFNRGELSGEGFRPEVDAPGKGGEELSTADNTERSPAEAKSPGLGSTTALDPAKKSGAADPDANAGKPCQDGNCAALNGLHTTQFAAGGALGMPQIGMPDPAFSPLGALEGLFGLPVDPGAKPLKDGAIGSVMDPFFGTSDPNGNGSQVSAAQDVAPANSLSLFVRVHSTHENALKRGIVRLFHKQL